MLLNVLRGSGPAYLFVLILDEDSHVCAKLHVLLSWIGAIFVIDPHLPPRHGR